MEPFFFIVSIVSTRYAHSFLLMGIFMNNQLGEMLKAENFIRFEYTEVK